MRPPARTILIALLTALLLAFFLRHADLARVWEEIRAARIGLIAAAVLLTASTYVVRAVRWQYLLRPVGRVGLASAFRTTVIGFAASFLLPARAGEFVRPYLLARREGLSATATFATIVVERLLDLLTVLLLLAGFLLLFDPGMAALGPEVFGAIKAGGVLAAAGALTALVMAFVLAGRSAALGRAAAGIEHLVPARLAHPVARLAQLFVEGLAVLRQPRRLLVAVLLSFPLWLLIAGGIWISSLAFQIALPFTGSFLVMALLVVGVSVPTPGGVGGFHAAYQVAVTTFYGAPNDRAVGAAIVLHAVSFLPVTIAGLLFMVQDGLSLAGVRRLAAQASEKAGGHGADQTSCAGERSEYPRLQGTRPSEASERGGVR